jgi:hypothetical protein
VDISPGPLERIRRSTGESNMMCGEVGSFPFGEIGVRSQESGDRSQEIGVRSQEIGVRRLFLFILPVSPIHHS